MTIIMSIDGMVMIMSHDQLIPPERGLPKGSQPQTLEVGCLAQIQQLLNQPPEQKD